MEYRIEQLAAAAEVGVDTIRYYQSKRLLPPPRRQGRWAWYSDVHLERLDRIRDLQAKGMSLRLIQRFLEGELDAADQQLMEEVVRRRDASVRQRFSLPELAERTGIPTILLEDLRRQGILLARFADAKPYGEADVSALRAGLRFVEAGVPLAEVIELASTHVAATEQTAVRAVELFDRFVRRPLHDQHLGASQTSKLLTDTFGILLEAATQLMAYHFETSLIAAIIAHAEAHGQTDHLQAWKLALSSPAVSAQRRHGEDGGDER